MYKITIMLDGRIILSPFYTVNLSDIGNDSLLAQYRSLVKTNSRYSESIDYVDFNPVGDSIIEIVQYDGGCCTTLSFHDTVDEVIDKYGAMPERLEPFILNQSLTENAVYNPPILLSRKLKLR